jgi:hypothetical protein
MRAPLLLAATLAAVLLLRATPASADQPDWEPEYSWTSGAMHQYFAGEKRGGWILVAMGAAGLGSGGVLVTRDSDIARGASYPLLGVGALHVIAGIFVYLSSNRRIDTFEKEISDDSRGFAHREQARIKGVRRQFLILKITEVVLIAGGGAMIAVGERTDRPRLTGVGIGVAIEAAATLVFDIVAARRAARYQQRLGEIHVAFIDDARTGTLLPALTYRVTF